MKVGVVAEVLVTYVAGLRQLRGNDLETMAGWCRTPQMALDGPESAEEHTLALRLAWVVRRVLGLLPTDSRCLIRSLVLARMLERRGIATKLSIGVKPGPPFEAHAWVEHDGRAVLARGDFSLLHQV